MPKVNAVVNDPITVMIACDGADPSKLTACVICNEVRVGNLSTDWVLPTTHELYVQQTEAALLEDLWWMQDYDAGSVLSVTMHLAKYVLLRSLLLNIGLISKPTVTADKSWEIYNRSDFRRIAEHRLPLFCHFVGKAYGPAIGKAQRAALKRSLSDS